MTETGSMKHIMTYGEKGPRDILGISNHWTQGVPLRTPCILGGFKCIKCREFDMASCLPSPVPLITLLTLMSSCSGSRQAARGQKCLPAALHGTLCTLPAHQGFCSWEPDKAEQGKGGKAHHHWRSHRLLQLLFLRPA